MKFEEIQNDSDEMAASAGGEVENADQNLIQMRGYNLDIPETVPIVGMDNFVLFPYMMWPLIVIHDHTKRLVDDALRGDRMVGFFLKRKSDSPERFDNLYNIGTLGIIIKMLRMPDDTVRLFVQGIERIRLVEPLQEEPYLKARIEIVAEETVENKAIRAMTRNAQMQIARIVELGNMPEDMNTAVAAISDPGRLADLIASNLALKAEDRQAVLELPQIEQRLEKVLELLGREIELLELGSKIQNKVRSEMDKTQRDYVLREQMKAIRKELGEDDKNPESTLLADAIRKAKMPKYARDVAEKELQRLEMMHPSTAEYSVVRTYLDWLVSLPWKKHTRDNMDIEKARRILDEDHYDLSDVKERILEYLSVIKLKRKMRGPILCFVGPPGVGKTSLGQSIARALGRKFYRLSLGGMRDEAEIRGHRRTYIGAMPGRLIKAVRDAGSNNPLIMLDEIDKIGADFRGDPASALLEVLDPAQNNTFSDNYLDMPFDLSNVMFITTSNLLDTIAPPLLDRMEVLTLSGYTTRQKVEIARRYLVPRAYENTGVTIEQVRFTDAGLETLAEDYTREPGVRNLEREIGNICRKAARRVAGGESVQLVVGPEEVENLLGPRRVFHEMASRMGQPGVAIGLAVTQMGGEILFIEAAGVPGNGQLLLTGQLGDVMKESAMAAYNYLHANAGEVGVDEKLFSSRNVHLHVPAGATPKDGPSAGIAIATALASLMKGRPVRDYLAMTGEITLKGNVLQVGGIKDKVLAAHRAGIKTLILPERCKPDLKKDVPEEVLKEIDLHFVTNVSEVLRLSFPDESEPAESSETETPNAPARKHRSGSSAETC